MPLKPIETRRLYQVVADQIAGAIRAGEYAPGERLPAERELSRRLDVSRPVIREAMIALEIAGAVEVRGGSGVFVKVVRPQHAELPDIGEDPYEAFVARRTVESEIAAIAAENATPADIEELRMALDLMRAAAERGPGPDRNDRRFHLALAKATGNTAFVQILHFIWDELLFPGPLWEKLRARRHVRPTRIAEHVAIVEAVAAHDPVAARAAMHAHFEGAIHDFLLRTGGAHGAAAHELDTGEEGRCALRNEPVTQPAAPSPALPGRS